MLFPTIICSLLLIPLALFVPLTNQAIGSSMIGEILGGNPAITSPLPQGFTVIGQGYSYNATSTFPDNGSLNWTLETDASWLTISEGGTGYEYCRVSGNPTSPGAFWANLTVNDTDSYNFLNWSIRAKAAGSWGFVETLSDVPTGTHDPSTVSLRSGSLILYNVDGDEESVVLGGTLYEFSRTNHTNITVASYVPNPMDDGLGWNMSLEVYPTREASSYRPYTSSMSKLGMHVYLHDQLSALAGVSLYVAGASDGGESISVYSAKTGIWTKVASDIIPATPNRHDNHPEAPQLSPSIYGTAPDRYIVSFRYASGASVCEVTIIHTSKGIISKSTVDIPRVVTTSPKLVLGSDVAIAAPISPSPYSPLGYWLVDNIGFRGLASRYIVADPVYEYVTKGYPSWVSVKDVDGNVITDAAVEIAGLEAFYIPSRARNEVVVDLPVKWNHDLDFSVVADGVELSESLAVTMMTDLTGQKVSMPLWWNGWAWATVLGDDDCSTPTDAKNTYSIYDHPATSYMMSAGPGSSSNLLASQSEMGIHFPHDYLNWPRKLWSEAVASADGSHDLLENAYTFASRWDDPSYVGVGDMFISVACPGNSGSIQQLYAQYARGTRIMGLTSNYANNAPGNHSLIGAWYNQTVPARYSDWSAPYSQWYPYTPYDMMDAARGPSVGGALGATEWETTFWVAQNGGVRRIYTHHSTAYGLDYLAWLDNVKSNFSYENWKATDGEVASYVFGRWSTDVTYDQFASNSTISSYNVSRQDPIAAGYWRVPVTIAFDATGRTLVDINITEDGKTYLKSAGTLRNLNSKRIMDVGYDIRGDTVFVSYFWNASSRLSFVFSDEVANFNTPPVASFVVDSSYGNLTKVFVFDATSSNDAQDPISGLMFRWSWDGDNVYETDWSSNPIAHHQFLAPGIYTIRLQVMDKGGLTGEEQVTVEVTSIEIPELAEVMPVVVSVLMIVVGSAYLSRARRKK
jgi:hypothetical protein